MKTEKPYKSPMRAGNASGIEKCQKEIPEGVENATGKH